MRGTDVAKALALGARAVAIGRLQGFGLAAAGADGLVRVLEILADELRIALSLLGVTTVSAIDISHLFLDAPPVQLPHETSAFFRTAAAVGPGVP
jgi:isopentenyl diphosphate isomerase/L-lactate dehydrogenase-like FMN-dependent dehydrogenase